jgi:membrane fusion protein (multidrug efflux system)
MTVDEASVDRIGEIEYVWVVERGRAEKRRVLTGSRENGQIEIIAGLQPGQIVVTSGQIKLSDGAKVKISNMPDPSAKIML